MGYVFYSLLPDRLNIAWRLALAFGAVPGITMIYFRVRMEETSRFAASQQPAAFSLSTSTTPILTSTPNPSSPTTYHSTASSNPEAEPDTTDSTAPIQRRSIRRIVYEAWTGEKMTLVKQNWRRLFGTAGNWFLLDITFYANGLFSTRVLELAGVGNELRDVLTWNIYLALAALPGYLSLSL
jgi:MFS transporter, PHS family, inorganic phosphate transporter